jgi:N-acetylneuraminic acid mutarotase
MAAAAYDGHIYAIAGEGPDGVSGGVFRYVTDDDRWEALSDKPTPVADVKGVLVGEKIYVPGGRLADDQPTDILEVYDPRRDTWEQKASLPIKVSGYALADFEGQIYLFGGWDGEKVLDIALRYDPQDDQWDVVTPMPTARAYAGAAEAGGKIYVIGGWDGEKALDVNESYAPARSGVDDTVWQDEKPIPNKGFGYAIHSIAEMIFLLDESGIWQYNTQEKSWTLISTMVGDFSPNSVGITGYQGDLFIFGGSDNNRKIVENWKFQMFFIIAIPAISK